MANYLRTNLLFLLCSLLTSSHLCQSTFFQSYGGDGNDYGEKVIYCQDSSFVAIGGTESYGNGLMDLFLLKIDSIGNVMWQSTFGGPGIDYGRDVVETPNGEFISCGYSNSLNLNYDIFLIKTDENGVQQWVKRIGGDDWDFAHKIIRSKANPNNYYVFGQTHSYGQGNGDGFVLKINSSGDSLWLKTYGGIKDDLFNDAIEDELGNIYCIGSNTSNSGTKNLWISKIDTLGNIKWDYFFNDTLTTNGNSITKVGNTNNKIIYSGDNHQLDSNGNILKNIFLAGAIDSSGSDLFTVNYNTNHSTYERSCVKVIPKPNSFNYYLISNFQNGNDNNVFYTELNNQWEQPGTSRLKGNGNDYVHDADTITDYHGFIVTGTTYETSNGFTDLFLSKTDSSNWNNNYSNNLLLNIPQFTIEDMVIYPNPSYDLIKIKGINEGDNIVIYDIQGRIVKMIKYREDGCSTKDLKSGEYWVSKGKSDYKSNNSFIKL